jgi:ornithine cyclodeaminase/alanine dehydrogenase-like protein (mu-crystallin family)
MVMVGLVALVGLGLLAFFRWDAARERRRAAEARLWRRCRREAVARGELDGMMGLER